LCLTFVDNFYLPADSPDEHWEPAAADLVLPIYRSQAGSYAFFMLCVGEPYSEYENNFIVRLPKAEDVAYLLSFKTEPGDPWGLINPAGCVNMDEFKKNVRGACSPFRNMIARRVFMRGFLASNNITLDAAALDFEHEQEEDHKTFINKDVLARLDLINAQVLLIHSFPDPCAEGRQVCYMHKEEPKEQADLRRHWQRVAQGESDESDLEY
jgi:hypothetical protein